MPIYQSVDPRCPLPRLNFFRIVSRPSNITLKRCWEMYKQLDDQSKLLPGTTVDVKWADKLAAVLDRSMT